MNINMNPSTVWSCHCVGYAICKGSDREQKYLNIQMEVISDIMLKSAQETINIEEILTWRFLAHSNNWFGYRNVIRSMVMVLLLLSLSLLKILYQ